MMMKNKRLMYIFFYVLIFFSCDMKEKYSINPTSKQRIYREVLSKIDFPPNISRIYLDTVVDGIFQISDRLPFVKFNEKKINFIDCGIILDTSSLMNIIQLRIGLSDIIVTDDIIFKMGKVGWDKKLISEHAMIIKFSKLFKNEYSNDYFFNISCICGKLCGNQIFVQFKTNDKGEILFINLSSSVS